MLLSEVLVPASRILLSYIQAVKTYTQGEEVSAIYFWLAEGQSDIVDVTMVKDYHDVFPQKLQGLPPQRDVDLQIELVPGARSVSLTPYRMTPKELAEFCVQLQELVDVGLMGLSVCVLIIWSSTD